MSRQIDTNLIVALDALLAEQSVTRAAERLRTSPAAMSRTLARLRRTLGDPLLVRAGQRLVPTPRAEELRDEAALLVRRCGALLSPGDDVDPSTLRRTFTITAADVVVAALAAPLLALAADEAPGVSVRFRPEELEAGPALREGAVDLEVGAIDHVDPETRTEQLQTLRMMAGVRPGHPFASAAPTVEEFAAAAHVSVSRRGRFTGPIDAALAERGLARRVVAALPSHLAAMALSARSDVVCLAPSAADGTVADAFGLVLVEVPLPLPPVVIGMAWHPRHEADGAHGWLRSAVRRALGRPGRPRRPAVPR